MHRFALALVLAMSAAGPAAAKDAAKALAPEDRYLWLEDVTGEKALDWARARNVESARVLETGDFAALEKRILDILDSDARIPYVQKLGPWYYNFWRDAKNSRGLWRRTTLAEYRKDHPAWETVIDLDALGAAEKESWVWHGADCLKPEYKRCLVQLSRGGADADVVREFDLEAKAFLKDGFSLPESKNAVGWRDADTLYVGTDFGPGSMTTSGYPRIAKAWKRGTPLEKAETVFEGKPDDVSVFAVRDHTKGFERDFVRRGVTFYSNEMFLRRDGKLLKIEKPDSANARVHRDLLLVELRDEWTVGGKKYPAGALLATDFEGFLKGARRFDVLFEPTERKSLAGFSPTLNHILLNELDNVRNRVYVLTRKDAEWKREPLPGMPEFGTVGADAVDDEESDDYFMTVTDYLTPTSLSFGTVGKGAPEQLKQLPAFFDANGLAVSQHETFSKDGTRIPYFQVSRSELALEGKNPTLLYGYGGFEIPMVPGYSGGVGASWLEKGGVYVVANIRGGGEFGPKWHQAALKANRHKAYEDFIAVAEDLVRRKVTSTPHLGIQGGSNGGLLMGNMLTMRPDLFGAIVCQVPLLDMRRYHTLLAGASWMGEYGNPDDPKEWAFIEGFSPYHNLKNGVKYPPTLFMTSTRDDRVHPGHARKMTALMLEAKQDVLYYENIEGGHGGAANNKQSAHMNALAYTFLWQRLSRERQ
jgi:prolyl oligopeptidase